VGILGRAKGVSFVWLVIPLLGSCFHPAEREEGGNTSHAAHMEASPVASENEVNSASRGSSKSMESRGSGFTEQLAKEPVRPWRQWVEQGQWQRIFDECSIHLEEKNGKDAWCWYALGVQAYEQKRWRLARYYWRKAKEQGMGEDIYYNGMALLALSEEEWGKAADLFKSAISMKGKGVKEAELNLSILYAHFKQWDKARFILSRIRPEEVSSVALANSIGAIALTNKDFDVAKKFFQRGYQIKDNYKPLIINYSILSIEHLKDMDLGRKLLDQWSFFGVQSGEEKIYQRLEKALASR
jgi:tetratricopeptide (TPR) repeat protein